MEENLAKMVRPSTLLHSCSASKAESSFNILGNFGLAGAAGLGAGLGTTGAGAGAGAMGAGVAAAASCLAKF